MLCPADCSKSAGHWQRWFVLFVEADYEFWWNLQQYLSYTSESHSFGTCDNLPSSLRPVMLSSGVLVWDKLLKNFSFFFLILPGEDRCDNSDTQNIECWFTASQSISTTLQPSRQLHIRTGQVWYILCVRTGRRCTELEDTVQSIQGEANNKLCQILLLSLVKKSLNERDL